MAWIFTQRGFLSVVAYNPKYDDKKDSPFKKFAKNGRTHLLVRARLKEDLEDIRRVFPSMIIDDQPKADYRYRAVVPRRKFKNYMLKTVDELQYGSHFKEEFRENAPMGKERYSALMSIWTLMAKFQPSAPYSGYGSAFGAYELDGWGVSGGGSSASPTVLEEPADVSDHFEQALWADDDQFFSQVWGGEQDLDDSSDQDDDSDFGDGVGGPVSRLTTLAEVAATAKERGAMDFMPDEVSDMNDEAFELYIRLSEKVGVGFSVTDEQIDATVAEVEAWGKKTEEGVSAE